MLKIAYDNFLHNMIGACSIGEYKVVFIDFGIKRVAMRGGVVELARELDKELHVEKSDETYWEVYFKQGEWTFFDMMRKDRKESYGL